MERLNKKNNSGLLSLLKPYLAFVGLLVVLTILGNGLNLMVPKIISNAIDSYAKGGFSLKNMVVQFSLVVIGVFIFTYLQSVAQVYTSEKVAKDLRAKLTENISLQDYAYIQKITPAKLLTNLTSDVDAVKTFVSQAITSIISSVFLIIGASILLLRINWKLALVILAIVPIVAVIFYFVLTKVRKLFKKSQEAIDWLNKVINESILGSALIRLLNSEQTERQKFLAANTEAKNIGFEILNIFAGLIPAITFCTGIITFIILSLGGHFVITGGMSLGNFTAFYSYVAILVFPILIIGFMSNVIAQAIASYGRISEILYAEPKKDTGMLDRRLHGEIAIKNVSVIFGQKSILKNISFSCSAGTKTAIIGPMAAGKTQLLYLLTGLLEPTSGVVEYDGKNIDDYKKESLHQNIGFVFQDSILFNLTLRENIAFSNIVKDEDVSKAIETAELTDFIASLPEKLDTIVSERGASLSGGQKQRIMLARALALNPKVLLLDDFTARVDTNTEQKILLNIEKNYPGITLLSVTQRIAPIENYNQIILLMDGEILAIGTHKELMDTSPEYVQIFDSQKSINNYELHP